MPSRIEGAGMSSTDSMALAKNSASPSFTGANVIPQLPITTDVTPCQQVDVPIGSHANCASRCVCTSTKPGVTNLPSASSVRFAAPTSSPIATIVSPSIATSARRGSEPKPSTTSPPLITTSCMWRQYRSVGTHDGKLHRPVSPSSSSRMMSAWPA